MKVLLAVLLISWPVAAFANDPQDWFAHLNRLGFWDRLAEIKAVSERPESVQRERVPALTRLLHDTDPSVRLTAAKEIAEIRDLARNAIPDLIDSFKYENGEEGMVYVEAVAAFGDQALPSLQAALESKSGLVRVRACDAIRILNSKLYLDGECRQKAP